VSWHNVLLNSLLSTTRYLTDHYADADFNVVGQEGQGGHIYRFSEFTPGETVIVEPIVDTHVMENPEKFVVIIREIATLQAMLWTKIVIASSGRSGSITLLRRSSS
jgi:hypothetical protein